VIRSVLRIIRHSLCLSIYVSHHEMECTTVAILNVVEGVDVPMIHIQKGVG
jgi:hypothetical protein